jgi:hypothetical protein
VVQGSAYKFENIADGVYCASVTRPGLGSNNVVVVNDRDVLIADNRYLAGGGADFRQ